jgi:hypothetical protein
MSLDDAAPLRPPPRAGFNMKAAMIVPGIGVVILVLFIGAGILTSNPVQRAKTASGSFAVAGTPLRATPAAHDLKVITVSGQPPGNIINAVSIPDGAVRVSHVNNSAAAQEYDAQIGLTDAHSQSAVEQFYRRSMDKQGWQISDTGPADHHPGSLEVIGKKAGSDGFFWTMGVVVAPTTFGASAPPGGITSFTVELFQQPDPD